MSFGPYLRGLRHGAGLSRTELARKAGVPVSTLRRWEGDRSMPGLAALVRLAQAPGVPVERFAEGVEDPETARGPRLTSSFPRPTLAPASARRRRNFSFPGVTRARG
jgi:transcriptional regulator with XRE-family HTH domain